MIKFINKKGFTLVETMVAIAVFSLVMVAAMSALLNVIDANNKAKSIKTAINNISFALEGISKDMRMGTDYSCYNDTNFVRTCLNGGSIIGFRSSKAGNPYVYYKYIDDVPGISPGQILSCVGGNVGVDCTGTYSALTSSEVNLTNVRFYVLGVQEPLPDAPNRTQPRMIMTVSGEAGSKEQTRTTFNLQTGVSQRIRPENPLTP